MNIKEITNLIEVAAASILSVLFVASIAAFGIAFLIKEVVKNTVKRNKDIPKKK